MMKVLNLLTAGNIGGIECLCRDIGLNSNYENGFCFLFGKGDIYDDMVSKKLVTYDLTHYKRKISFGRLLQLRRIAKEYDIITVHHGDAFLKFYHWLLTKIMKKKFVTVAHSCCSNGPVPKGKRLKIGAIRKMFLWGLRASDKIVFVAQAGQRSYENAFDFRKEKGSVIYNGIGMDKLSQGQKHLYQMGEEIKIMYIGRLVYGKGIHLLMKAFAQLEKDYPVSLHIVGDGAMRENLERGAIALGIVDKVHFYGQQVDIVPYLQEASIFVYPSIVPEVFGLSIVEAMAFGIPCVSNRVGGVPEIIIDGKNGFLTEKISVDSLVDSLRKVIRLYQEEKLGDVIREAKATARRFSIEHTVLEYEKMYRGLL